MQGQLRFDPSAYGEPMPYGPYAGGEEQQDLSKALTAGDDINAPAEAPGVGFPLRKESLDSVLYNLSFRMEHLQVWPDLLKEEVGNTVNEHNTLEEHGSGVEFFHTEGDLPGEDDSTWKRNYTIVRSMGVTRRYSIMSAMTALAHANADTHQTIGGTMWTLQQLERSVFTAQNALLPQAFDGYDAQVGLTRDLRGKTLTGEEVNYATSRIFGAPNYGKATDLYMPVGIDADFIDDVAPNARYQINPTGYTNGHAGMQIRVYDTQRGPVALRPDVFVEVGDVPSATAKGNAAKRPATPTVAAALAASGSGSQFTAADSGAYRYKVVAVNEYGLSAPLTIPGTVTPTAGQEVTFSVADGNPAPRYYIVYRSPKGGALGTEKEAFKVAADSSGTTAITDTNAYLPGTGTVYLIQQNREFNKFNRLMRFMKVRLGLIDASHRFMLLLFGNLVVHAPNKSLRFINVARSNREPALDI